MKLHKNTISVSFSLYDCSIFNGSIHINIGSFVKPNGGSRAMSDIVVEARIVSDGRSRMQRISYLREK